jgi:hypothetical protein
VAFILTPDLTEWLFASASHDREEDDPAEPEPAHDPLDRDI